MNSGESSELLVTIYPRPSAERLCQVTECEATRGSEGKIMNKPWEHQLRFCLDGQQGIKGGYWRAESVSWSQANPSLSFLSPLD